MALTQKELKEVLIYDQGTGVFTRIVNRSNRWKNFNMPTGTIHPVYKYRIIQVLGRLYHAHRLAWLYVYGYFPDKDIDHVNGVRDDNRISNLREATRAQNSSNNTRARSTNRLGVKGVTQIGDKFLAQIMVNYKNITLGLHPTVEEASEVYKEAKRKYHGEFNGLGEI